MESKLKRRPTAYCILVDIDLLLDTRLGVLETLYPGISEELLKNGYYDRFSDNFSLISNRVDQTLYETTYKSRNKTHLMATGPTGFFIWLSHELTRILRDSAKAPIYDQFFLDINFNSQYRDLSQAERQEIMEVCGDVFNAEFSIEEVNLKPENLTPYFLNNNYNQAMMYNYIQWFEHHYPQDLQADDLDKKQLRLPNCDIMAPGIVKNHVKKNELAVKLTDDGDELPILEVHTRAVSPIFTLNYVHPGLMSLIDPMELKSFIEKTDKQHRERE